MRKDTVIIGAGAAGLLCADRLKVDGITPLVFDKGTTPGGRLSTRKIEGGVFCHGASSIPDFKHFLGISDFAYDIFHRMETKDTISFYNGVYQPTTSVSNFVKVLQNDTHVVSGLELKTIDIKNKKLVLSDRKMNLTTCNYKFLILALPVFQAIKLLKSEVSSIGQMLEPTSMKLSVAGMYAFKKGQAKWKKNYLQNEKIYALFENSRFKNDQKFDCWTVHSKDKYSYAFEEKNKSQIRDTMLTDFINLADVEAPDLIYKAGHRWLFGFTEKPLGLPYLLLQKHSIGICGDWCLGPSVLHAANSGIKLAEEVIARKLLNYQ